MQQPELDFGTRASQGLDDWRAEQRKIREELGRSLGLPLGKSVEIWLRGGVRLRGELRLVDSFLLHAQSTLENTRFEVDGTPFVYAELESCIQL